MCCSFRSGMHSDRRECCLSAFCPVRLHASKNKNCIHNWKHVPNGSTEKKHVNAVVPFITSKINKKWAKGHARKAPWKFNDQMIWSRQPRKTLEWPKHLCARVCSCCRDLFKSQTLQCLATDVRWGQRVKCFVKKSRLMHFLFLKYFSTIWRNDLMIS